MYVLYCLSASSFVFILIDSFIHIEHLYSASSRELLRGAPNSNTAKKSSLKLREKRRWQGSRENPKFIQEDLTGRSVIVIVISKLLKRCSKAKRTRAPAYSRALLG